MGEKWMWFAGVTMDALLGQLRLHAPAPLGLLPDEEKDPRIVSRTNAKWKEEIEPQVIKQLAAHGNAFILGDFSAVDVIMGYNIPATQGFGLSRSPELLQYLHRCSQ